MIPILLLLIFAILGTVAYKYINRYLHQEQVKILPPNKFDQARYNLDENKGKTEGNLNILISLSIKSGLSLASFNLIASIIFYNFALFLLLGYSIFLYQLILIVLATVVVYFIYSLNYQFNHPVSNIYRICIPLVFNLVGGYALYVAFPTIGWIDNLLDSYNYRNVAVTIKDETFIPSVYYPTYEVVLDINNPSRRILNVDFFLVTNEHKGDQDISDFISTMLGSNGDRITIYKGESEVTIDVSIYVNEHYPECKDGTLEKPLYLLYSTGSVFKSLAVSDDINRKILEMACNPNL